MTASAGFAGRMAAGAGLLLWLALAVGSPSGLSAIVQEESPFESDLESGVTGSVVVREQRQPAVGAQILIDGDSAAATDSDGEFLVLGLASGAHRFAVRYRGTDSNALRIDLVRGEVLQFHVLFDPGPSPSPTPPVNSEAAVNGAPEGVPEYVIPELLAEVEGRGAPKMRGFEERRAQGGPGRFVTRSDIEEATPLFPSDLIKGFPGVKVLRSALGPEITMRRGSARCRPTLYIDGSPTRPIRLDDYGPEHIEAIEVYGKPLDVPAGFRRERRCGAILIWTRERRP